jgi:hypothetical protein
MEARTKSSAVGPSRCVEYTVTPGMDSIRSHLKPLHCYSFDFAADQIICQFKGTELADALADDEATTFQVLRAKAVTMTFPEAVSPVDFSRFNVTIKHVQEVNWCVLMKTDVDMTYALEDVAKCGTLRLSVNVVDTMMAPLGHATTPAISPDVSPKRKAAEPPAGAAKSPTKVAKMTPSSKGALATKMPVFKEGNMWGGEVENKLMQHVATFHRVGIKVVPLKLVTGRAGYTNPASRKCNDALQALQSYDAVKVSKTGKDNMIAFTANGVVKMGKAAERVQTNEEAKRGIMAILQTTKTKQIFEILADGENHEIDLVGNMVGNTNTNSPAFAAARKELKDFGLLENGLIVPSKKVLRLLDTCFPEGRPPITGAVKVNKTASKGPPVKPDPKDVIDVESGSEGEVPKIKNGKTTLKDEEQVEESTLKDEEQVEESTVKDKVQVEESTLKDEEQVEESTVKDKVQADESDEDVDSDVAVKGGIQPESDEEERAGGEESEHAEKDKEEEKDSGEKENEEDEDSEYEF